MLHPFTSVGTYRWPILVLVHWALPTFLDYFPQNFLFFPTYFWIFKFLIGTDISQFIILSNCWMKLVTCLVDVTSLFSVISAALLSLNRTGSLGCSNFSCMNQKIFKFWLGSNISFTFHNIIPKAQVDFFYKKCWIFQLLNKITCAVDATSFTSFFSVTSTALLSSSRTGSLGFSNLSCMNQKMFKFLIR